MALMTITRQSAHAKAISDFIIKSFDKLTVKSRITQIYLEIRYSIKICGNNYHTTIQKVTNTGEKCRTLLKACLISTAFKAQRIPEEMTQSSAEVFVELLHVLFRSVVRHAMFHVNTRAQCKDRVVVLPISSLTGLSLFDVFVLLPI